METAEFLDTVITTDSGNLVLCARNHSVTWTQEFHQWPNDKQVILNRIGFLHDNYDLYFSAHLFSDESAEKNHVLNTRTIQADLDHAQLDGIKLSPSILVETSPNRYQAYWILDTPAQDTTVTISPSDLEALSKKLTYSIPNSDHTGWSLGHRLRLPGTLNFKYNNGPHEVKIIDAPLHIYLPEDIEVLPSIAPAILAIHDNDFLSQEINLEQGPYELVQANKDSLPQAVYTQYMTKQVASDRSEALWYLMCSLFEIGLSREKVFWIAKHSVNNKFAQDLRYNADRELAKDVLRAEQKVKIKPIDIKGIIDQARVQDTPKIPGGALFKRRHVMDVLKTGMQFSGKFLKVTAGLPYFVPNDTGRPIALTHGSEQLRALMNIRYGINAADPEYKYLHTGVIDAGITIEQEIDQGSLSYYDSENNCIYFHTGKKDVLRVSADEITYTINGENNVLFPWHDIIEPFTIDMNNPYPQDQWAEAVFGDLHSAKNMTPQEALTLLKVWLIFSLFRSGVSQRPILALFGPPNSGKSTIPHFIYTLFYAKRLAVQGVTNSDDFDITSTKLPVYAIDNLDTYVAWILDRLAQSIGDLDFIRRKQYTDIDVIKQRRQSLIVVTAHNPKFTREDITGRLLLIVLDEIRGQKLFSETERKDRILKNRPALWAAILKDVQKVLSTPRPKETTVKWRIQDFVSVGEWIAIALNCQDDFNNSLRAILGAQASTLLQQEENLAVAVKGFVQIPGTAEKWMTANDMWNELLSASGDQEAFKKTYKNPTRLSHKIQTMKGTLRSMEIEIDTKIDEETRSTVWNICQTQSS